MPSLVEIGPVVLEKRIFKFRYFVIISPWKRFGHFIWRNLNPPHPRMHCAKFGWNRFSGSGGEAFLISSIFLLYHNYLPLLKPRAFIEPTWIPFTEGCIVSSLVEIGPVALQRKIFFKISLYFYIYIFILYKFSLYLSYFVIISPWKKVRPFIWINLNPFSKGCFVPSLDEIDPVFWRRRFLKVVSLFLLIPNYLPLEKGMTLRASFEHPLNPRILCAKFGWNWENGSWEDENVKLQTDRWTDRRQTTGDQKSSRAFSSGEVNTCWWISLAATRLTTNAHTFQEEKNSLKLKDYQNFNVIEVLGIQTLVFINLKKKKGNIF